MKTRSQTKYEKLGKYEVNIDFDAASEAWRANKKFRKNNKNCVAKCLPGEVYCRKHLQMFNDGKF